MKNSVVLKKILFICALSILSGCAKLVFSPAEVIDSGSQAAPTPTQPLPSVPTKTIHSTETVAYGNKQVDFLLVLDDSNSMLPELQKLAQRMGQFLSSLEDSRIDWQMCLTTTRGISRGATVSYGSSMNWSQYNPSTGVPLHLLKKGTANLQSIFTATVNNLPIGGGLSGDERAIKATYEHFSKVYEHDCYRPNAAVSVIIISDEDERSVGNNPSKVKAQDNPTAYQPFEFEDYPVNLLTHSRHIFGADSRFTFSSIIVRPEDTACEIEQDKALSPSHPGYTYQEMSLLTDGGIGSICDQDYADNLNNFKYKIVNSLSNLILECIPLSNSLKVIVEGLPTTAFKLDGTSIKFAYPLSEGTKIDFQYECLSDSQKTKNSF